MPNSERGEFALAMGGRRYTLKVGAAALRECQEVLGENGTVPTIDELMKQVKVGRLKYVRALLWAGLQKHHADEFTLDAVDDLMDQAEPDEVRALLGGLGMSMQPDPADVKALGLDRPTPAGPPDTGRQTRKRVTKTGGGRSTPGAAGRG